MTILEKIKGAALTARKERNVVSTALLVTVVSEIEMIAKNSGKENTDADTIGVIKKFIKGLDDTMSYCISNENNQVALNKALVEKMILTEFLPKQMTDQELVDFFNQVILYNPAAKIGNLLGELKTKHLGSYDGASASTIAKGILK